MRTDEVLTQGITLCLSLTRYRDRTINAPKTRSWCAFLDLNQGPHPYQGCVLTGLN